MASTPQRQIKRFGFGRIVEHQANALAFIMLVITGLSQRSHEYAVSHWIIKTLGGVDAVRIIHRWSGVLFIVLIAVHIAVGVFGVIKKRWPASMMVNMNDFRNAVENLRYYFGITNHPALRDRYDYKQKFEYWGVIAGGFLMIATGLILWFPVDVARYLPGELIQAEYDAIQGAVNKGVAFAVAAGNDNADANNYSPGGFDNVLSVSALADFNGLPGGGAASTCRTDQDDTLAAFSNWGPEIDIAAPGVCILSTYPLEQGEYGTISGTSMASPHAAGALALLASANNPANATDVYNLYTQIKTTGNYNWTDDSDDGIQEPVLDVSNTASSSTRH